MPRMKFFKWVAGVFSSGAGIPSVIRILMFITVIEILRVVDAIRVVLLQTGSVPETPVGTAGFLAGVLGILTVIKGYADQLEARRIPKAPASLIPAAVTSVPTPAPTPVPQ